jgi:hypothetical protein
MWHDSGNYLTTAVSFAESDEGGLANQREKVYEDNVISTDTLATSSEIFLLV